MKITKRQLEQLIKEAVRTQGGNAKTQQIIVESVKRRLNEIGNPRQLKGFAIQNDENQDREEYIHDYGFIERLSRKYGTDGIRDMLNDIDGAS